MNENTGSRKVKTMVTTPAIGIKNEIIEKKSMPEHHNNR